MYGNGAKIGIVEIIEWLIVGYIAYFVVVAGTMMPDSVARHAVATTPPPNIAPALVFALSSPSNDFLLRVIHSIT